MKLDFGNNSSDEKTKMGIGWAIIRREDNRRSTQILNC